MDGVTRNVAPAHSTGLLMSSSGQEQDRSYGMPQTLGANVGTALKGGLGVPQAMSDEQLYNLVMSLKANNPSVALPPGMHPGRHLGMSGAPQSGPDAIALALPTKDGSKLEQGDQEGGTGTGTGTGSSEDDRNSDAASRSKRVLANRQSAHRSRLRKLQYIQDLENNVNRIQAEIANLQPQLSALRTNYLDASAQNNKLRESVNALMADARHKEARNTTLRQEAKDLLSGQGGHVSQAAQSLFGSHPNPINRQFGASHSLYGSVSTPIASLPQMH